MIVQRLSDAEIELKATCDFCGEPLTAPYVKSWLRRWIDLHPDCVEVLCKKLQAEVEEAETPQ